MKKKIFSVLIALFIIFSIVPATLSASGDNSGSSLENAFPVSDQTELDAALTNPAITFIETDAPIVLEDSISIPSGKTLIVRASADSATALSGSFWYSSITVESGATLINEGGLGVGEYVGLTVEGTMINRAPVYQTRIELTAGGTFTNEATGLINAHCIVMAYGGTLTNSGTILSSVYRVGAATPTITGVPAALLGTTNAPISYEDLAYPTLTVPASVTRTVGLPGDDSTYIIDPDDYFGFAVGYSISLSEGQTLVGQCESDYRPYYYLMDSETFASEEESSVGGFSYTADEDGTYYLLVEGYDTYDNGTFTLTVYNPAEFPGDGINLTLDPSDPDYVSSGTGWSWDTSSSTLTLSGAYLTAPVYLPANSTLTLAAGTDNFIQLSGEEDAITSDGNLIINGGGNLTVNSYISGIVVNGSLQISVTGALSVAAYNYGIASESGTIIEGCPDLKIIAENYGLFAGGDLRITNSNAIIYGGYYGIWTDEPPVESSENGGNILIQNSTVYAYCDHIYGYAGIYAGDNLPADELVGHSEILLTGCDVELPDAGRIVDVDISNLSQTCQTVTAMQDISLVTNWSQAAKIVRITPIYNVLYNANGGTGTLTDPLNSYWSEETVTVLGNTFTRTSFVFDSWNTAANGSGTSYDPADTFDIASEVTLYAQWTPVYTVTFADWNGAVLSTQSVISGGGATAPSSPARTGYNFTGWSVAFSNITSNLTVTALYDAIPTPTPTPTATPTPIPTATPTPTPAGGVTRTGEVSSSNLPALILLGGGITAAVVLIILKKKGIFGA